MKGMFDNSNEIVSFEDNKINDRPVISFATLCILIGCCITSLETVFSTPKGIISFGITNFSRVFYSIAVESIGKNDRNKNSAWIGRIFLILNLGFQFIIIYRTILILYFDEIPILLNEEWFK